MLGKKLAALLAVLAVHLAVHQQELPLAQ